MSFLLCEKTTDNCFDHVFENIDSCDSARNLTKDYSGYTCKPNGKHLASIGQYEVHTYESDQTTFLTNKGFQEYEPVHITQTCGVNNSFCSTEDPNFQCCVDYTCVTENNDIWGKCSDILPKNTDELKKRIEKLNFPSQLNTYYSNETKGQRLVSYFKSDRPQDAMLKALHGENGDLSITNISKLRNDNVLCYPNVKVGSQTWNTGPYECYTSS